MKFPRLTESDSDYRIRDYVCIVCKVKYKWHPRVECPEWALLAPGDSVFIKPSDDDSDGDDEICDSVPDSVFRCASWVSARFI